MEFKSLMIGGLMPAALLGVTTIFMKLSLRSGMSVPAYLVVVGLSVIAFGCVTAAFMHSSAFTQSGILYAFFMGLTWAAASFCMSYGISTLKMPVSMVAPLSNTNALVAILLGALVFAEWKDLNVFKIIGGTVLIVAGASIVSTAADKV